MKILIYIALAIISIAAIFFVVVSVVTFYRLATGKISKEEQQRILEADRRMKENKRKQSKGGSHFHFLSYPSPLNNWGLWH